jgi:hypothetical protein
MRNPVQTGIRQIPKATRPSMLSGDNVLQFKGSWMTRIRKATIFAPVPGSVANKGRHLFIHDDGSCQVVV